MARSLYKRGALHIYLFIGTAITAFSLVMTGWFTGFLQEYVGYRLFFLLVAMLGVISFIVTYFLPVTKEIGKRKRMG